MAKPQRTAKDLQLLSECGEALAGLCRDTGWRGCTGSKASPRDMLTCAGCRLAYRIRCIMRRAGIKVEW